MTDLNKCSKIAQECDSEMSTKKNKNLFSPTFKNPATGRPPNSSFQVPFKTGSHSFLSPQASRVLNEDTKEKNPWMKQTFTNSQFSTSEKPRDFSFFKDPSVKDLQERQKSSQNQSGSFFGKISPKMSENIGGLFNNQKEVRTSFLGQPTSEDNNARENREEFSNIWAPINNPSFIRQEDIEKAKFLHNVFSSLMVVEDRWLLLGPLQASIGFQIYDDSLVHLIMEDYHCLLQQQFQGYRPSHVNTLIGYLSGQGKHLDSLELYVKYIEYRIARRLLAYYSFN